MKTRADKPDREGVYACLTGYGWKILCWHKGEWWIDNLAAKYVPGANFWIGPLNDPTEFDL